VIFDYNKLKDRSADLTNEIEEAFGPEGFGICAVTNIPNYT